MGRKNKKRTTPGAPGGRTPIRTPTRTPTNLSAKAEPFHPPAQQEQPEQIEQIEQFQQPSPPLSAEFVEPPADIDTLIDTSFPPVEDIESIPSPEPEPPVAPPSPPHQLPPPPSVSPTRARHTSRRRKSPRSASRRTHHEAHGPTPHVIACISCSSISVLTGVRGIKDRHKICPEASPDDRFFPIVCDECENIRGTLWLRQEGGLKAPSRSWQRPITISPSMLANWPLYSVVQARFGVEFDAAASGRPVVVSKGQDWWREGILTDMSTICMHWEFDEASGELREKQPHPRKDAFFGQPPL